MKWYLHYDDDGIPAGFFDCDADTPFIEITEEEKHRIESNPLAFRVIDGLLTVVEEQSFDPNSFLIQRMNAAPKYKSIALATDINSVLLAVTGLQTGNVFQIRAITPNGEKLIPVTPQEGALIMQTLHKWLANDNLRETR